MFVGRERQLAQLGALWQRVHTDSDGKPGRAMLIRGRRRVGKSRLVEEFLERADVPHLYFAATGRAVREELQLFRSEAAASTLPRADLFAEVELSSWDAALRLLATAVGDEGAVVVLDELPYLVEADPHFEGTLQRAFDRELSRRRVLLIGIGSDLAMMEALGDYGRPFHQRASEMVVPSLSPAEVGDMLGLAPADALDAYVVTGGLPLICAEWDPGMTLDDYLAAAVTNPTSALLVSGERSLAAEFPSDAQARTVLSAIGSGERTFTAIGRAAGGMQQGSLNRALKLLAAKRLIAVDEPLSTSSPHAPRYRVADSYLRFWLAFLGSSLDEIERGRGDRVLARIATSWTSWRGRAVEPVIRELLGRIDLPLLNAGPGVPGVIGGYWTRTNDPEIDLVIADRAPMAKRILAVGSIKWREAAPFDGRDLGRLHTHRAQLPGASDDTPLLAVSRSGCTVEGVTVIGPAVLLDGYRSP